MDVEPKLRPRYLSRKIYLSPIRSSDYLSALVFSSLQWIHTPTHNRPLDGSAYLLAYLLSFTGVGSGRSRPAFSFEFCGRWISSRRDERSSTGGSRIRNIYLNYLELHFSTFFLTYRGFASVRAADDVVVRSIELTTVRVPEYLTLTAAEGQFLQVISMTSSGLILQYLY